MSYVLGVDGGNSKTIAMVARTDGAILGVGRGRWSDIYGAPSVDAALGEIERAVIEALNAAGVTREELIIGAFSMAGADWPEDFELLHAAMQQRGFGRTITVVNDALGGLRAGSPDGNGVVVACGTGAALAARSPDGKMWHASFWQEPHGGHDMGNKMLRAVYRAELGIDPPTALDPTCTGAFRCSQRRSSVAPADRTPDAATRNAHRATGACVARRSREPRPDSLPYRNDARRDAGRLRAGMCATGWHRRNAVHTGSHRWGVAPPIASTHRRAGRTGTHDVARRADRQQSLRASHRCRIVGL